MPTSTPPRPTRGAAHSTPPSAASSDADLEGGRRASLYSLISQSLQGCNRREQEEGASSRSGIPQRMRHHSAEHSNDTNTEDLSSLENSLSPWEEWFICKEKELRARFQAQAMEAMHKEMEKIKEDEEREKKKIIAAEKHKEWVQRKNEEEKRERERKLSKEMAEKAAKELKKAQSKEKAREVYLEWLKKKNTEEVQKKKDEKEKEKQLEAELQEKKQKSEKMFKEWLQNAKQKTRPESAVCVNDNGKHTGFLDGSIHPAPSFCNPIPWKPIHVPPPKEEKAPVSTQVRLFGE
ncbi:coiled-coil domain-containing protein 34 isoform X2 [Anolis carolinensis]|uniref:coiled-coil domain-containing protein 34 isoform X2 n=1 Tax=Anolis carolinensis TaxID=28377 RepID=UPI002F2B53B5